MPDSAVTWLGHATVLVEMDGVKVLTDPVLTGRIGPLRRYAPAVDMSRVAGVDVVLVSHLHRDHLHLPSLRRLDAHTRTVVPRGAGGLLRDKGHGEVVEVEPGDSFRCGALTFRAVHAKHSGFRPPFGPRAPAVGYVIRGSRSIYFPGDTGLFDGMSDISDDLDLALVPVGGWWVTTRGGHMGPREAAESLKLLRPRRAVPVHWGTLWPMWMRSVGRDKFEDPGDIFAAHAAVTAPCVDVRVLRPGERMALDGGMDDM